MHGNSLPCVLQYADTAHDCRGVYGTLVWFPVVEAHVAGDHGYRFTLYRDPLRCVRDSPHPLCKGPELLGNLGVAVVEAVCECAGGSADCCDIAHGFHGGIHALPVRGDAPVPAVAVCRDCHASEGFFLGEFPSRVGAFMHMAPEILQRSDDARICFARLEYRVADDVLVVVAEDRHFACTVGVPQHGSAYFSQGEVLPIHSDTVSLTREARFRSSIGYGGGLALVLQPAGDIHCPGSADGFPFVRHFIHSSFGHFPYHTRSCVLCHAGEIPCLVVVGEDVLREIRMAGPAQAFLRFGTGDDFRREPFDGRVHIVQMYDCTESPARDLFHTGAHSTTGTEVFAAYFAEVAFCGEPVEQGVGGGEQVPLQKGVGFLHSSGILVALLFLHGCAGERRSAKAAPVCGLADEDDVISQLSGFFRGRDFYKIITRKTSRTKII